MNQHVAVTTGTTGANGWDSGQEIVVEGVAARVTDPETAVYLQRYLHVSYQMLLVRLRAAGPASEADVQRLRQVRPVHLAGSLGDAVSPDEWAPDRSPLQDEYRCLADSG